MGMGHRNLAHLGPKEPDYSCDVHMPPRLSFGQFRQGETEILILVLWSRTHR